MQTTTTGICLQNTLTYNIQYELIKLIARIQNRLGITGEIIKYCERIH